MINFQVLNPKFYLSGAIVIGFLQIIDGMAGINHYSGSLATAFSMLEMSWFLFSMVFFYIFRKKSLNSIVPGLFMTYTVYGWFVGSYLLSQNVPGESIELPLWYMVSATLFGLTYSLTSAYLYRNWYLTKN